MEDKDGAITPIWSEAVQETYNVLCLRPVLEACKSEPLREAYTTWHLSMPTGDDMNSICQQ